MKYIAKGIKTNAVVRLEYSDGILMSIVFAEANLRQVEWLLNNLPSKESELEGFGKTALLRISHAAVDLSFDAFWNAFKYKVGKKARTRRLWEAMAELQKQTALSVIPRYHRFIAFKHQESAYPETWLNNEMWENDYVLK